MNTAPKLPNDDPRDDEYRSSSGGAAVAIALVIMFIAMCLQGAIQ